MWAYILGALLGSKSGIAAPQQQQFTQVINPFPSIGGYVGGQPVSERTVQWKAGSIGTQYAKTGTYTMPGASPLRSSALSGQAGRISTYTARPSILRTTAPISSTVSTPVTAAPSTATPARKGSARRI